MIKLVKDGNIFESQCDCLVNPVNCVGICGKGLALDFKKKFPMYYNAYAGACMSHVIRPGIFAFHPFKDEYGKDFISFPTKDHWMHPSNLEDIAKSLKLFAETYNDYGIKSIAFPALGCGCGGLRFQDVLKVMRVYLENLPILVEVYAPKEYDEIE